MVAHHGRDAADKEVLASQLERSSSANTSALGLFAVADLDKGSAWADQLVACQKRMEVSLQNLSHTLRQVDRNVASISSTLATGLQAPTPSQSSAKLDGNNDSQPDMEGRVTVFSEPAASVATENTPNVVHAVWQTGGGGGASGEMSPPKFPSHVSGELGEGGGETPTPGAEAAQLLRKAKSAEFDDRVSRPRSLGSKKSALRVSLTNQGFFSDGEQEAAFIAPTLPLDWPVVVKMRTTNSSARSSGLFVSSSSALKSSDILPDHLDDVDVLKTLPFCIRYLRDPNSAVNIFLELFLVFILAYDLTVVPYTLAWQVQLSGFGLICSWMSLGFWTTDVGMSFLRGYYQDGELVVDFKLVALNYLRSWFLPDFAIVFCEWISIFFTVLEDGDGDSSGSVKILRLVKLGKILRLISALRIIRFVRVLEAFIERSMSEVNRMMFRIATLCFFFLWCNHMLSCAWFAIGTIRPSEPDVRWTEFVWEVHGEELPYLETAPWYQYVTALHWAVAQTTLGAMEITPANSLERMFNIFCLTLGLIFGITLVSSLSAMMVEAQVRGRDRASKLHLLRRYLNENDVPRRMALQIQKQVVERLGQSDKLTDKDVAVLDIISVGMKQDLQAQITKPFLKLHPLFHTFAIMDLALFRRIAACAAEIVTIRAGDDIFVAGAEALSAYLSISGVVNYIQDPGSSPVKLGDTTEVFARTWMSEMALWCDWIHVGSAQAKVPVQVLLIKPDLMWEALRSHIVIFEIAKEYCVGYHRRVTMAKPPELDFPSDLWVPLAEHGDIVCSMTHEAQRHIGLAALTRMKRYVLNAPRLARGETGLARNAANGPGQAKLEQEIVDGKSVVILTEKGRPERVVSIVVLSLKNGMGNMFTQIATVAAGHPPKCSCILPGVKRQRDEYTSDALDRLLSTKLKPLNGSIKLQYVENTFEEKESKGLGVLTKYMRTICHADLLQTQTLDPKVQRCTMDEYSYPDVMPQASMQSMTRSVTTTDANEAIDKFRDIEVFWIPQEDQSAMLCAWLPTALYDWLQTTHGERELKMWVNALRLPSLLTPSEFDPSTSQATATSGATVDELCVLGFSESL